MNWMEEDLERKMINWQRWKIGGDCANPLGWTLSRSFDYEIRGGYREAVVPILAGEARDVDAAVNSLETKLRIAVHEQYLQPQKSDSQRARVLGVGRTTFYNYLAQAKVVIARFLRDQVKRNRERSKMVA